MTQTTDQLTARRTGDEGKAQERFSEATRSSSFSLGLGVREVRLIGENDFRKIGNRPTTELAAYQKLVDKGLVTHVEGEDPELSEAGKLVRQLLVLSNHVLPTEKPEKLEPDNILAIISHALSWYRDGNYYLDGVRVERGETSDDDKLRITTKKVDREKKVRPCDPQPYIRQEFVIRRSNIEPAG